MMGDMNRIAYNRFVFNPKTMFTVKLRIITVDFKVPKCE